jgi:phage shock protein E
MSGVHVEDAGDAACSRRSVSRRLRHGGAGAVPITVPGARMKRVVLLVALGGLGFAPLAAAEGGSLIVNPAIDVQAYLHVAGEAARHREAHRLSEDEFIRLSREPGTIILDARSRQKYDELHIKGAINLSFPDIAIDSLERTLPDKAARILIYCNNNFTNAEGPFPSKLPSASLNIPTYIALYDYGYGNVYELGPLLDVHATRIEFESSPPAIQRP